MSTVAGNPCCAWSPIPSVILPVLRQRAADVAGVVGRINWTWRFVRGVGRDGGDEVVAEPSLERIGELVSRPRPCGAGPRREGLNEAESFRLSSEASTQASGESENLPRPRGCLLALIFARLKQYFWSLLRVPLLVVSDTDQAETLPIRARQKGGC